MVEGGVGSAAHSKKNNVFAYRKEKKNQKSRERGTEDKCNDTAAAAAAQLPGSWTRLEEHLWFSKPMLQSAKLPCWS